MEASNDDDIMSNNPKQNNELDYPNLGSIFDKHRLLRYKTNQKNNLVNLDHDIN
jgi:hypothetical protein